MAVAKHFITPEEYLQFERQSEEKHEYYNGEIINLNGVTQEHALIVVNVGVCLHSQVSERASEVYISAMRMKIPSADVYLYPDVTVVSDRPKLEDKELDTLLNPTLVVEVLSPSTEKNDRGRKFQHYRTLDSLREYLLISQESVRVEHYVRQMDNQWLLKDATSLDSVLTLPSVNCTLPLVKVYEKVTFEDEQL